MDFASDETWDRAFRESVYRLRFELGGEELGCDEAPAPRFVQALTRSRLIRDAVFADASKLYAIVASTADPSRDFYAPVQDSFDALSKLGFRANAIAEWRARLYPHDPEPEDEDFIWRAFDVSYDLASQDAMLWCSLAYEMPIGPKSPVLSWLADFEKGILFHVYDDRGMDVTALTAPSLLPFYRTFDHWLLDYDRERMKAAFTGA